MAFDEERMMILQMVADKKISAAEAAELLKALDGAQHEDTYRKKEDLAREIERTARTVQVNARQMVKDVDAAIKRENLGGLLERLFEKINLDFGDDRVEFEEIHEGTFSTTEPRLNLRTGNGKLHIHGWDEPGYKAVLTYKVKGARDETEARAYARDRIRFEGTDKGITLDGHDRVMGSSGISVSVELWIPRDRRYHLQGRTGNGSLLVDGRLTIADGDMSSGNGSIRVLESAADSLKVSTGNGSLTVEADAADITAQTGNGSLRVRLTGSRSQKLHLTTGNGSARIDLSALPKSIGFRLDASTGMGSVNLHMNDVVIENNVRTIGHKHIVARSQNYDEATDRVDIRVSTGLGSITID